MELLNGVESFNLSQFSSRKHGIKNIHWLLGFRGNISLKLKLVKLVLAVCPGAAGDSTRCGHPQPAQGEMGHVSWQQIIGE